MYFVIYNPVAGRGRARAARARVERFFQRHALPYRLLISERPGHATELANALPPEAAVLALGGDGTVHEAAAACVGGRRTLGVLPGGSGDDFAFALGLARHDLEGALEVVRRGHRRWLDSGVLDAPPGPPRPFVNAVGVGFDAEVAARVVTAPPPLAGPGAYLYAVAAALGGLAPSPVSVTVDGVEGYRGPALLVSVHNGPRTGGSFPFAPDARLDDGLLDVVVAGRFGRLGTLGILPRAMRGRHLGHPEVRLLRGREVAMAWRDPRPAHLEGQGISPRRRFAITVRPRSLRVFAPVTEG